MITDNEQAEPRQHKPRISMSRRPCPGSRTDLQPTTLKNRMGEWRGHRVGIFVQHSDTGACPEERSGTIWSVLRSCIGQDPCQIREQEALGKTREMRCSRFARSSEPVFAVMLTGLRLPASQRASEPANQGPRQAALQSTNWIVKLSAKQHTHPVRISSRVGDPWARLVPRLKFPSTGTDLMQPYVQRTRLGYAASDSLKRTTHSILDWNTCR